MKLQSKITCFALFILVLSIGSITVLSYFHMKNLIVEQYSTDLLDVSRAVSENYMVKQYLSGNPEVTSQQLNEEIENIRSKTKMSFIVVMDMKGIRKSHPIPSKIGKPFEGGDEKNVLEKGLEYSSEAKGTLGISFRAFTPVKLGHVQVGAVCVGVLKVDFSKAIYNKIQKFLPFIIFGLGLGALGAVLLSFNIKKAIFGLEPKEIALILKQKDTVLENVKEGIVSLDQFGKIVLFNKEAAAILGLKNDDLGKAIGDVVEGSWLPEALTSHVALHNIEVKVKPGLSIMSTINPLMDDQNQVIGVVVNFRNLTEIKNLAEELTGAQNIAWSLRAQNHEFMNKLHTIAGLIQLEEYKEALQFISSVAKSRDTISSILTENIKEPSLSAILLSKYNKAEECRVRFAISPSSALTKLPEYMTAEELVSIVGNLIENALDAVSMDGSGEIDLRIVQDSEHLFIKVKDNGVGIKSEHQSRIYEQGFTTKEGQRGLGMFIVKRLIDEAKGEISLTANGVKGTVCEIAIPMKRGDKLD